MPLTQPRVPAAMLSPAQHPHLSAPGSTLRHSRCHRHPVQQPAAAASRSTCVVVHRPACPRHSQQPHPHQAPQTQQPQQPQQQQHLSVTAAGLIASLLVAAGSAEAATVCFDVPDWLADPKSLLFHSPVVAVGAAALGLVLFPKLIRVRSS